MFTWCGAVPLWSFVVFSCTIQVKASLSVSLWERVQATAAPFILAHTEQDALNGTSAPFIHPSFMYPQQAASLSAARPYVTTPRLVIGRSAVLFACIFGVDLLEPDGRLLVRKAVLCEGYSKTWLGCLRETLFNQSGLTNKARRRAVRGLDTDHRWWLHADLTTWLLLNSAQGLNQNPPDEKDRQEKQDNPCTFPDLLRKRF